MLAISVLAVSNGHWTNSLGIGVGFISNLDAPNSAIPELIAMAATAAAILFINFSLF